MNQTTDDPFRYCVYCNADCWEDEPEHTATCPSSTGVFPVREQDLGPKCPGCGYQHGMVCMDCGEPFKLGDRYMHREVDPGDPHDPGLGGASINEIVCVGCAGLEALT